MHQQIVLDDTPDATTNSPKKKAFDCPILFYKLTAVLAFVLTLEGLFGLYMLKDKEPSFVTLPTQKPNEPVYTYANVSIIFPVKNTEGFLKGPDQVTFTLTDRESRLRQDWIQKSNKTCPPKFADMDKNGIKTQAEFNQRLAAELGLTEKLLAKNLHETKGFPPAQYLNFVAKLIKENSNFSMPHKGEWKPDGCDPGEKLLVLVPYRDRGENLLYFIFYMHLFLQKQQLHYQIILVEQLDPGKFRRANLFNAIVFELFLKKKQTAHCLALHDIDKIPYSPKLSYRCQQQPFQICRKLINSQNIIVDNYYEQFFGGVTLLNRWSYYELNGMSNAFSGWGGEDDDLYIRTVLTGVQSTHADDVTGKFVSIEHRNDRIFDEQRATKCKPEEVKKNLIDNGLYQLSYRLQNVTITTLYTVYSFTF